uniref:Uncharacterized protein n=1 Tax=Arundo donax TaxID=35708 RepID=A0A0A9A7F4_ARUDO
MEVQPHPHMIHSWAVRKLSDPVLNVASVTLAAISVMDNICPYGSVNANGNELHRRKMKLVVPTCQYIEHPMVMYLR